MSNAPATMKREPIWKNGGKLTKAKRIAKYVDPHTRYTAASAAAIRVVEGLLSRAAARVIYVLSSSQALYAMHD